MTLPTKCFCNDGGFYERLFYVSSLDGSGKSVGLFTKAVSGFFFVSKIGNVRTVVITVILNSALNVLG
jgi:hypothetical protein